MALETYINPKDLSNITVGDLVEIKVIDPKVIQSELQDIDIEFPKQEDLQGLKILEQRHYFSDELKSLVVDFKFQVVSVKNYSISPIKIKDSYSDPVNFSVHSVLTNDGDESFKNPKSMIQTDVAWYKHPVKLSIGIAVLLLLLIGSVIFIRKILKREKITTPVPAIPPELLYEQQFREALKKQHWKIAALNLSDYLRLKLQPVYGIQVLEMTSRDLENRGCQEAILQIFKKLDLVKFAKIDWSTEDAEKTWIELKGLFP